MLIRKDITGSVMMVTGAVMFAVMALFVRMASATVPVGMIICVRYGISTLIFIPLIWLGDVRIRPVNYPLLVGRAVAASLGGIFYFLAVSSISLAEAVILKYTFPLFAVTISALFFHEKTTRLVVFLLLWSFAGVFIMMNPGSFNLKIGYVWGMLNALTAGVGVSFVRKLRFTDDSWTIMFFTSLAGLILSLPLLAFGAEIPDFIGSIYMLLAAGLGILAQFALVYGMRYIKTGAASVIMMIEVVVTTLLGFVVLGAVPTILQVIGGSMVLIGGALLVTRESRRQMDGSSPEAAV
ncbi:DMT family transporter [bacterium]|nr:DMT family transporter [bacterium]